MKRKVCAISPECWVRFDSMPRESWTPANMGRGADARLTRFLHVEYDKLRARVLEGGTDTDILEWCYATGHGLDEGDIIIWNGFMSKLGWNDFASDYLTKCKAAAGLANHDDIQTISQLFDVEE